MKSHPALGCIKRAFILLVDSMRQEFRQSSVGTTCVCSTCLGPQLGGREGRGWNGLDASLLMSSARCWLSARTLAGSLPYGLSTGAGVGSLTAWRLGPRRTRHECTELLQSSVRSHFPHSRPVKAVTKVCPRFRGGDTVRGPQ